TSASELQATSELSGEAAGCFAGNQVFRHRGIEIYVFSVDGNPEIVRRLNLFPNRPPETPDEIAQGHRRRDEFIGMVKRHAKQARRTKTNDQGQYRVRGLAPGKEYLVIGIVPPAEDSEEYFLDKTTDKLKPGRTTIDLWEGTIPKDECHP
ncbi:MAG: hypothetical protein ACRD6I_05500, partial [Candidatus Acidiferrales bacterium]